MGLARQHGVHFFVGTKNWGLPKNVTLGTPVSLKHVNIVRRMKAPTHKIKKYKLFLFLRDSQLVKFQGELNCNIVYTDINLTYSNISISWEGKIESQKQVVGILLLDNLDKIFANLKTTNSTKHTIGEVFRIRYSIEFNRRVYDAAS